MLFFILLIDGFLSFPGVFTGSPVMAIEEYGWCKQAEALTMVHALNGGTEPIKADHKTIIERGSRHLGIKFEVKVIQKSFLEVYVDGIQMLKGLMPEGFETRWEASWSIQVRIGNAGGVKAKINGRDYVFGIPGQIVNKVIIWEKDQSKQDMYHLKLEDW